MIVIIVIEVMTGDISPVAMFLKLHASLILGSQEESKFASTSTKKPFHMSVDLQIIMSFAFVLSTFLIT